MDSICHCNVDDEEDYDDTANTVNCSINVDTIVTEDTGAVSSVIKACDTDVSHQGP